MATICFVAFTGTVSVDPYKSKYSNIVSKISNFSQVVVGITSYVLSERKLVDRSPAISIILYTGKLFALILPIVLCIICVIPLVVKTLKISS